MQFWESLTVERHYLVSQFRHTQTADAGNSAFETQIEQIAANADRLKDLRLLDS
jgi:hypothetical protein